MWLFIGEIKMNWIYFFLNGMVSINHSELCISMNFYFHFIQRMDRLVSEFPLFFFFLKTWMHIWFLSKRERESRKEEERELMGMPRGKWSLCNMSQIHQPSIPSASSVQFFQMKMSWVAMWDFTKGKWLALEPLSARSEELGLRLLSPVPPSCYTP